MTDPTTNAELYKAIGEIAKNNKVDIVYYFTMENVLGEWDVLAKLSLPCPGTGRLCSLMILLCQLLTYLNEKYRFIHWDLHQENILVKTTKANDFDPKEYRSEINAPGIERNDILIRMFLMKKGRI